MAAAVLDLLYSGPSKGRWMWGFVPLAALPFLTLWQAPKGLAPLFGVGGGIITLSYIGVLWHWMKTHTSYEGTARTGKHLELLGFSFMYATGVLLCVYFGAPVLPGMAELPPVHGLSILIAFSAGCILLFAGQYLSGKQAKQPSPSK